MPRDDHQRAVTRGHLFGGQWAALSAPAEAQPSPTGRNKSDAAQAPPVGSLIVSRVRPLFSAWGASGGERAASERQASSV